jgi:Putative lumazine-binding
MTVTPVIVNLATFSAGRTARMCGEGRQSFANPENSLERVRFMQRKFLFFAFIFLLLASAPTARAQSAADAALIKQTALDYIEGWYEGNAERMERALHPELAKRIVRTNKEGASNLGQMGAMALVQGTKRGGGKNTPKEKQQKDVTILDAFENAASVKVVASDWIDYLHVAKYNGRWVIVNVLWELKPQK